MSPPKAPKLCYLQETCPNYTNGSKRKAHHIRLTDVCKSTLDYSCEMYVNLLFHHGIEIACDIDKMRRLKNVET